MRTNTIALITTAVLTASLIIFTVGGRLSAQKLPEKWARQIKGITGNTEMQATKNGCEYMVCSNTSDTAWVGGAVIMRAQGVLITKYDSTGKVLWTNIIRDSNYNANGFFWPVNIKLDDSDNIYVLCAFGSDYITIGKIVIPNIANGSYTSNSFVAKYTAAGKFSWVTPMLSGHGTYPFDFNVDSKQNTYVLLSTYGDTLFVGKKNYANKGGFGTVLIKLNPKGTPVLNTSVISSGSKNYNINSVACNANGYIDIGGYFSGAFIPGDSSYNNGSITSGYVAAFDTTGKIKWCNTIGDVVNFVQADNVNNVYAAGTFSNTTFSVGKSTLSYYSGNSSFLAKFNSNGTGSWAQQAAVDYLPVPCALQLGNDGNIYMAGTLRDSTSIIAGNSFVNKYYGIYPWGVTSYLLKLDTAGNTKWLNGIYGGWSYLTQIYADRFGNAVVGGTTGCTLKADSITLIDTAHYLGHAQANIFVVTYNASGQAQTAALAWSNAGDTLCSMQVMPGGNIYIAAGAYFVYNFPGLLDTICFGLADTFANNQKVSNSFLVRYKSTALNTIEPLTERSSALHIYPNPSNGQFTIDMPAPYQTPKAHVQIINLLGQVVDEQDIDNTKGHIHTTITYSNLAAGVYMVKVKNGTASYMQHVVIEK